MGFVLDKINPEFRKTTDLLFFTDRMDIDCSNYKNLLGNDENHYLYLRDRLTKSMEIFWDQSFWDHRLDLLISLGNYKLQSEISSYLEMGFRGLIRFYRSSNNLEIHNGYIQYISLCKALASHKENIMGARSLLLSLPFTVAADLLLKIVSHFIPFVFPSMEAYGEALSKTLAHSSKSLQTLELLEKKGVPVNKSIILKVAKDLFFGRALNRKNRRSLFQMMKDDTIRTSIKEVYAKEHRSRLLELINKCDFGEIERDDFINVLNILDIDSSVADELLIAYADKLHARGYGVKKANIDRIIRVLKKFPQCSPKKILVYLSNNDRMSDIKYLMKSFPELKKLAAFV